LKIFIATPMYGGNAKAIYVLSIIRLIEALTKAGHEISYDFIMNESLITRARNALASNFLNSECDAMLFIDADLHFKADDVVKMIESGEEFIGGVYPLKTINWDNVKRAAISGKENIEDFAATYVVSLVPGIEELYLDQPTEVEYLGTGMMFLSRKVLEEMAPHCETYYDARQQNDFENIEDIPKITEFFKTEITEEGLLLSEDYSLCHRWRKLGNKVYAALWVDMMHSGEHLYYGPISSLKN